tara:strand:- start:322 stop:741 length:420 start_codon:yes stop_codon:yes gene_type:complete
MEIFLFILSFITGGVVFTTIYITTLTSKLNKRVTLMDETMEKGYNLIDFEIEKLELDVKDVKSNVKGIQIKLAEDGYAKISEINKDILVIKDRMKTISEGISIDKATYNGEIRRLNGMIQNTTKMINTVRDDPNTLSRY